MPATIMMGPPGTAIGSCARRIASQAMPPTATSSSTAFSSAAMIVERRQP